MEYDFHHNILVLSRIIYDLRLPTCKPAEIPISSCIFLKCIITCTEIKGHPRKRQDWGVVHAPSGQSHEQEMLIPPMGHGAETDRLYIKSGQKNGQPEVIVADSAIRFEAAVAWSIRENCPCDCPDAPPKED